MNSIWKQVWRGVEMTLVALGLASIYVSMARPAWGRLGGIGG